MYSCGIVFTRLSSRQLSAIKSRIYFSICYSLFSNISCKIFFALSLFVSHLCQSSSFGIYVLRTGEYFRMYSPSFSPNSAILSA